MTRQSVDEFCSRCISALVLLILTLGPLAMGAVRNEEFTLIGGLIIGMMTGKSLAMALNKPFLGINHLEGHALTARLTDNVDFPYLLLLVSGGHTQLIKVSGVGNYARLATTIDDALGEAFDKTAKLLCIGHPGGPGHDPLRAGHQPDHPPRIFQVRP